MGQKHSYKMCSSEIQPIEGFLYRQWKKIEFRIKSVSVVSWWNRKWQFIKAVLIMNVLFYKITKVVSMVTFQNKYASISWTLIFNFMHFIQPIMQSMRALALWTALKERLRQERMASSRRRRRLQQQQLLVVRNPRPHHLRRCRRHLL